MTTLQMFAQRLTASTTARTISGPIAPYGVVGFTSLGATIFEPGSLSVPEDLSRAKLLVQHDTAAAAVGYMASVQDTTEVLAATFDIPAGPEGDEALRLAAAKLRDGLSVGVQIDRYSFDADDNLIVHAGRIYEVSLVTIPAFDSARVLDVAANRKEQNIMPKTPEELAAERAAAGVANAALGEQHAAAAALTAAEGQTPALPAAQAAALPQQAAPIQVQDRAKAMDLSAAMATAAQYLANGGNPAGLSAALQDVLPADDAGEGFARPTFLGQLWQAFRDDRPLIDAFGTPSKLTGLRAYGWRYDLANIPKIERYEGNKTAIPSNKIKTVSADSEAQDFAAGWDIARKLIDLGSGDYIESIMRMVTGDYRLKTEAWFAEVLAAEASPLPAVPSVVGALTSTAVAAASIGAKIGVLKLGLDAWEDFISLKASEVPWWLQKQGEIEVDGQVARVGGVTFSASLELAPTQVLAADKRAATYYEAGAVPIRVVAQDIPRGGVDLGVFGYAAAIVNDPRAILTTTITPAAAPAALDAAAVAPVAGA